MKKFNKTLLFYILVYSLIAVIGMWALSFNIKTNPIHHDTYVLKAQIKQLEEENKELELFVVSANRYERLEKIAKTLQMAPPKKLYYLQP